MKPIYHAPLLDRLRDIEKAVKRAIELEAIDYPPMREQDRAVENLKPDEIAIWDWVIRPRFPDLPEKKPAKRFDDCTEVEQLRINLAQSLLLQYSLCYPANPKDLGNIRALLCSAHDFALALENAGLSHYWRSEVVSPTGCEEEKA